MAHIYGARNLDHPTKKMQKMPLLHFQWQIVKVLISGVTMLVAAQYTDALLGHEGGRCVIEIKLGGKVRDEVFLALLMLPLNKSKQS